MGSLPQVAKVDTKEGTPTFLEGLQPWTKSVTLGGKGLTSRKKIPLTSKTTQICSNSKYFRRLMMTKR